MNNYNNNDENSSRNKRKHTWFDEDGNISRAEELDLISREEELSQENGDIICSINVSNNLAFVSILYFLYSRNRVFRPVS